MIKDLKLELNNGIEQRHRTTASSNGIERGKTQGAHQKEVEIAKKMKQENIDLSIIIKITGLTTEEIEKL